MNKLTLNPYWYLARELIGNQYIRLLWHKAHPPGVSLLTQHFHLTLGQLTLEIDW